MWYFKLAGRNKEYNVTDNADKAAFLRTLPQWEEVTEDEYARWQVYQNEAWKGLVAFSEQVRTEAEAPDADSGAQPADAGIFDLIERRIMKSGDTRFLEGIDEAIGLETAKYINDQSIALRNSQKGAMSFYEMYREAQAALATERAENARLRAAIAPFVTFSELAIQDAEKQPWYNGDDSAAVSLNGVSLTYGNCRRLLDADKGAGSEGGR